MTGHAETVARLAALLGVAPSYRDAAGRDCPLSPATQDGMLRAFGHDPGSPGAVRDAVAALEAAPWSRVLPPMVVLSAGVSPELAPVLPEPAVAGVVAWRIELEDGSHRDGRADLDHLPVRAHNLGRRKLALALPADLPPGYHRMEIAAGPLSAACLLARPPPRAWCPDWLARGERRWGIGAALFALWSDRSWGIGDFGDLAEFARRGRGWGAGLLGINPLHAPMPGEAADANPYRPSSRQFLNPLHLDLAALGAVAPAGWPPPESGVDHALVHRRKHAALREIFAAGAWDAARFAAFRAAGGAALERFALFNALADSFAPRPWRDWPAGLRHPDAPGIAEFRRGNAAPIAYHAWLQWLAEQQLERAAHAGAGLYRDLAIGVDPDGAERWAAPELFIDGARIGAPPDAFNPAGQDWGLPPPDPRALTASGYGGFLAVLRANLRHAAALRVDHVVGIDRLFVIPPGAGAAEGAYLRYPREDLLGLLTLESHRARCLLIGEDLGTVPEGLRERLAEAGILSYRLMLFERWPSGLFHRPGAYPRLALAAFATHDLPSFCGWWAGSDISAEAEAERQQEREWLLAALRDRGLAPAGVTATPRLGTAAMACLLVAMHSFLARGPAALVLASLGDLLAEQARINRPGGAAAMNWRQRYTVPIEALDADERLRRILAAIAVARTGPADTEN